MDWQQVSCTARFFKVCPHHYFQSPSVFKYCLRKILLALAFLSSIRPSFPFLSFSMDVILMRKVFTMFPHLSFSDVIFLLFDFYFVPFVTRASPSGVISAGFY